MLKTSSIQQAHSPIVLQEIRDLFPLLAVAVCLFIFAVVTVAVQSPKSKPVVRNEVFLLKISQP